MNSWGSTVSTSSICSRTLSTGGGGGDYLAKSCSMIMKGLLVGMPWKKVLVPAAQIQSCPLQISTVRVSTGTRIIYERRFLLQMKNSPLAKTPPATLATIPDIINEDVTIDLPQKIQPVQQKRIEVCSKDNQCKCVLPKCFGIVTDSCTNEVSIKV